MIKLAEKKECTGCSACYSVCPTEAITMEADKTGFLYPIIDSNRCIECRKCEKACPVLTTTLENESIGDVYIARILDKEILAKSSSGAMAYAIGLYIIQQGGIVFGVVCDEHHNVYHNKAEKVSELSKFQGSKYVQSDIQDTFTQVKKFLEEGKYVLFTGTPCQIYGLKATIQSNYENLICVDIFCRSVASPLLFKQYVNMQNEELGNIQDISFKDKERGYDYPVMKIEYLDTYNKKRYYARGSESDAWLRLFLSNEGDRPSCRNCIADSFGHCSDITIGDFNNRSRIPKSMNDNLGCSKVMINTKKGERLFLNMANLIEIQKIQSDNIKGIRPASVNGKRYNKKEFFIDAKKLDGREFYQKYFPETKKTSLLRLLREMLYHTGTYSLIKNVIKKHIKKS